MARIEGYTAKLDPARGVRGQVGSERSMVSAAAPGNALNNLGETIQRSALTVEHIGNIIEQRKKEEELHWVVDRDTEIKRQLYEFERTNQHREDFGPIYREFADNLLAESESKAPSGRASAALRRHVLPAVDRLWNAAEQRGEANRLTNFKTAEEASSAVAQEAFVARYAYGEPEAARDSLRDGLNMQLARIQTTWGETAPSTVAELSEKAVVSAVMGAAEKDPSFARSILNQHRSKVDVVRQQTLLNHIDTVQMRDASLEVDATEADWKNQLANGIINNQSVQTPDIDSMKGLFRSPEQFKLWANEWRGRFEAHNTTVNTVQKVASLNPQARAAELSKLKLQGESGLVAAKSIGQSVQLLNKELETDSFGYVTKYNEDIADLERNYVKAAQQASKPNATAGEKSLAVHAKSAWRRAAWERQGPPLPRVPRPTPPPPANTYQNLPEAQRRIISEPEAKEWGGKLTQGGWKERMAAMREISSEFTDKRMYAVALKDIEQLNPGKQDIIQRLQLAQGHEQSNPALAQFILSDNGGEAWKGTKDQDKTAIKESIDADREWNNFSLATRGATGETQDMVNGYRQSVEQWAAFNISKAKSGTQAGKDAIKSVITDTQGRGIATPAYGNTPSSMLYISRKQLNPKTGKEDSALALRKDDEMDSIAARLASSLQRIKSEDFAWFDSAGNPTWFEVAPWAYGMMGKEPQVNDAAKERIKVTLQQRSRWISDPDGQGATLYILGVGDAPFAPLRKDGQPLHYRFNEIPLTPAFKETTEPVFPTY